MAIEAHTCRRAIHPGISVFDALMFVMLLLPACRSMTEDEDTLFTLLDERQTRVTFVNRVEDEPEFNILEYLYFYDGGGVALGDVNNDGLVDLFFTGNQVSNRLYLNRGAFEFEDITDEAGVGGPENSWSTGVTMADVNADGWLDIYVCQVVYKTKKGRNLLYINNRDNTFTEQAAAYGLDFEGMSTQAAFFDYDRDDDLDLYLLNHAVHTRGSFVESWMRIVDAPRVGDRLYRNDAGSESGPRFVNVTSDAGIYSSTLGYGLGLAISDVNLDGWPDIYVGNDFHENDYLYLNNRDGTFSEALQRVIGHTSQSSMGNDIADFNNDGRPDIVSLDMLPPDLATYRKSGGPDPDDLARIKRNFGYAPQYARNTLQLHRGFDADGFPLFSEIGLYAGIEATDWSWAGLFVDLDNDGWKDLYITNGIPRRPNDLDYSEYISQPAIQQLLNLGSTEEQLAITRRMPSIEISNYAFRNNRDVTFSNRSKAWGLDAPGFSNGAAYGDLDNDGDVDLVVNNINRPAFVYRNNSDGGHALTVRLEGEGRNTTGIGARVVVYADGHRFYQELMPVRGFQSSVSHALYFGLGDHERADSLVVVWPDGRFQRLNPVSVDQTLTLDQRDAAGSYPYEDNRSQSGLFQDITSQVNLDFTHREDDFEDYEVQPLIPHRLSIRGPALAIADVNGDDLDDFFVGGAHGQSGKLFVQTQRGDFLSSEDPFIQDRTSEDVDAAFFDADGDGDSDLYVVSGGGRYPPGNPLLQDRLYLNDGGQFDLSSRRLPDLHTDGCCVAPADYDRDGDIDLFVGSLSIPGSYGLTPASYLLENDGAGVFADVTNEKAGFLTNAGMITDALWADLTGNGLLDLVVAGEWMPVTILQNSGDALHPVPGANGLDSSNGWWHSLLAGDFDGDGDVDLAAGNLGVNSIFEASRDAPLELFVNDFDNNAATDPIVVEYRDGRRFTWARRAELLKQVPALAQKLPTNALYAEAALQDIFDEERLESADRKRVYTFESTFFENRGAAGFASHSLPMEAQWSPLMGMLAGDFNEDGHADIVAVGNFFGSNTKQGRYDAGYGSLLVGNGAGSFSACPVDESWFIVRGDVRRVGILRTPGNGRAAIVARNDAPPQLFRIGSAPTTCVAF